MKKILILTLVIFTFMSMSTAFAMRPELAAISSINISPDKITAGSDVTVTITSSTPRIDHMVAQFVINTGSGAQDFNVILKPTSTSGKYSGSNKLPSYIIGGNWKLGGIEVYKQGITSPTRISYSELIDANKATTFNTTSDLYNALIKDGVIVDTNTGTSTTTNTSTTVNTTTSVPSTTANTTTTASTTDAKLTDIKGHWAQGSIQKLIDRGFIKGFPDGYFLPNKTITRAEFIKILVSALGLKSTNGASAFSDTKTHWARNEIAAAKENHITDGYADGTFRPNKSITRAEIVSMLSTAKQFPQKATTIKFSDVKKGYWAEPAIYAAAANNIVSGYKGGLFKPKSEATRAEASSMIDSFLTLFKLYK